MGDVNDTSSLSEEERMEKGLTESPLSDEEVRLLEEAGFVWDARMR